MPDYSSILAELIRVLQSYAKEGQHIAEDSELVAQLGLDSVKIMDLLLRIEDHYDISIPLNILPDIRTVKDLAVELEKLTRRSS